ncbi:P-type DNA transfer protein VirB5 [Steroidobacter agaridevorans]|uniref:P-type DNA transfer protein VirB5 n=1 Tax=Steroidobacter agaridevorans TaxID=2695856 RepID=A0A829YIX9_9GAMM|nr:type IV secretion system protein [Steroidobacter agaridevorans]GFE82476.1 P-type DNA transfer protein VirB5 [Steroidobacter agaridevorans]
MKGVVCLLLFGALGMHIPANAQIPVTDVGAITQLIMQLEQQYEQLDVAQDQLAQVEQTHAVLTGSRGMQRLLSHLQRNYLPHNAHELNLALQGISAAYPRLSAEVRSTVDANSILTAGEIAVLDSGDRAELEAARRAAALHKALSNEQLATTSDRFAALQELIDALGDAHDPKASLDLTARIAAEQTMAANEANKLRSLDQALAAEERLNAQRRRERVIQGIGSLRSLPPLGLQQ